MYDNVLIISGCHYFFNGISVSFIGKTFGSFFTKQEIGINVKTNPSIFKNIGKIFLGSGFLYFVKANNVWNAFRVDYKDPRTMPVTLFWSCYCQLWPDFTHCSGVSIVDFKQVNTGWIIWQKRLLSRIDFLVTVSDLELSFIIVS